MKNEEHCELLRELEKMNIEKYEEDKKNLEKEAEELLIALEKVRDRIHKESKGELRDQCP